jgi:hypothetical protein
MIVILTIAVFSAVGHKSCLNYISSYYYCTVWQSSGSRLTLYIYKRNNIIGTWYSADSDQFYIICNNYIQDDWN